MQLAIRLFPPQQEFLEIALLAHFGLSVDNASLGEEVVLVFQLSEEADYEAIGCYLQRKVNDGGVVSFFMADAPEEEEDERITIEELEAAFDELSSLSDTNNTRDPNPYLLDIGMEAILQAITIEQSYTCPHTLVELPQAPAMLFPLKHAETGSVIWIELFPTHYGLQINAHQTKPSLPYAGDYSPTGMAGVHLDYYLDFGLKGESETLKVQLHDETHGPYAEPHWSIPSDYSHRDRDASICLISDTQGWKPAQESSKKEGAR